MKNTEQKIPALRFPEFSGEWEEKRLGEIVDDYKGGASLSPSDFISFSDYEVIPKKGITRGGRLVLDLDTPTYCKSDFYQKNLVSVVDKNYLITTLRDLVPSGPTIGYIVKFTSDKKYMLAQGVYGIKLKNKEFNEDFLIQYSNSDTYRALMKKIMVGSTQVHIRNTVFFDILLPNTSLLEQQKIADFLSAVDTRLQLLKDKKTKLEEYKRGVMQHIFSQELRFTRPNGSAYPDWEEKKLGEIGNIITGKTPNQSEKYLWGGDVLFVTPTDIGKSKYQCNTERTIKDSKKYPPLPEDAIIFTCIASIGKMCISGKKFVTNQQINSIVPHSEYNPEFIYYAILDIVDYIKSTQSSNTLPIINKSDFSRFKIQIPHLDEQRQIADFLSAIDDKISLLNQQIQSTEQYKKGLLQQMFV